MAQQVVDHPQLTALDVFLLGLAVTHGKNMSSSMGIKKVLAVIRPVPRPRSAGPHRAAVADRHAR
jgi:hypothetical protein